MKLSWKVFSLLVLSIVLIGMSIGVAFAGPPVVSPGTDPSAVLLGGVRYRELATGNDPEVFIGVPDLGDAARRTGADLTWSSSNAITFTYNPLLDKLTTTVDNGTSDWTVEYLNYADNVRDLVFGGSQALADEALGKLNYMQIDIRLQEGSPAQASLDDVYLDTNLLGSFSGVNKTTVSWQVNGYDLSSGFTLTGTLNLANVTSPSAELNKVDITIGNVNADVFNPTVSNVVSTPNMQTGGGSVTLTATVDDSGSGGSIIQSADYSLDSGAWTPMSAVDGAFDSQTEDVTADLLVPAVDGAYGLCVRGTDSANNTSTEQCTTLYVDSQGPLTSSVLVDPVKTGVGASVDLTAIVDDTTTGGLNIQSAEYSTNGVDWTAMTAQDGNFDSATEVVTAALLSPDTSGDVNVCVRGTDAAGNTGAHTCTTLNVDAEGPSTDTIVMTPNPADPGEIVTLTATVSDSTTGNSSIASAAYQVDGGAWTPMLAVDGVFDSPTEQVTAQFTAPAGPATVSILVRGTDAFANDGDPLEDLLEVNAPPAPPPLYLPIAVKNFSTP